MELNDILGLGKVLPLDKLLIVLEKGIGRATKGHFDRVDIKNEALRIRKLTEARADGIKMIGNAINENLQTASDVEFNDKVFKISKKNKSKTPQAISLKKRTEERLNYQAVKSQLNIENIASYAADELKNDESITDEPIDSDWITRFFKIAEDISNDEMQILWGKILAGEVKRPNSFSIRTLEIVKNVTKVEAEVFTRIANYAITSDMETFFIFRGGFGAYPTFDLDFNEITLLTEIGLLRPNSMFSNTLSVTDRPVSSTFVLGGEVIVVDRNETSPLISFQVDLFTNSGNEMLRLLNKIPPENYLSTFATTFNNPKLAVKRGELEKFENDKFYFNELTLVAF